MSPGFSVLLLLSIWLGADMLMYVLCVFFEWVSQEIIRCDWTGRLVRCVYEEREMLMLGI